MESREYVELKDMIQAVDRRTSLILKSLQSCQKHCYVDNPPGRWRGLGRAIIALIRF